MLRTKFTYQVGLAIFVGCWLLVGFNSAVDAQNNQPVSQNQTSATGEPQTSVEPALITATMDKETRLKKVSELLTSLVGKNMLTQEIADQVLQACVSAPEIVPGKTAVFGKLETAGILTQEQRSAITTPLFGAPNMGPGANQTAPEVTWIDPDRSVPYASLFKLYDTPARGAKTQGSYLIYLPPSYTTSETKRYPVIYFLHGGFGNQHDGANVCLPGYIEAMQTGKMPETIIVVPHAIPSGWYTNSKDGSRPVENVIIQDLVPHIDNTYRTINKASARGIEGMSMGGFGALHLGIKFSNIFGVISAVGASINPRLADEPTVRTADTFFGDEAYYVANSPQGLATTHAAAIVANNPALRILGGTDDPLRTTIINFSEQLTTLKIKHTLAEAPGAGHDYKDILAKVSFEPYAFWKDSLVIE